MANYGAPPCTVAVFNIRGMGLHSTRLHYITVHPIFPCTITTSPMFAAKERLVHIALGEFEENVRVGRNELIHIQLDPRLHPRHQDGSSGAKVEPVDS